jgi:uncharacterized protein
MDNHKEIRFYSEDMRVETRAVDGADRPAIVGNAVVYNAWTTIADDRWKQVQEVVRPGAFKSALEAKQDIRALINHNPDLVLGRTRSGTLELRESSGALETVIYPPETTAARDLMELMRRGDVSGMSFAFTVRKGGETVTKKEGEDGRRVIQRELTDLDLYDVSVVTYPAYEQTHAAIRSHVTEILAEAIGRRELTDYEKELVEWASQQRNYRMTLEEAMNQGR